MNAIPRQPGPVNSEIVAHLVAEMDHYFEAFDHFPLYLLGWELNDGSRTVAEKHDLAKQAFEQFTAAHPSTVVLVRWPLDLEQTQPLPPGTPLDFELDPEGPSDSLLQVLVPQHDQADRP